MRSEDFDLNAAIERHARDLCREIRSPRRRKAAVNEYIEHMEDATYQYMLTGMNDADAFFAAVADIGDREKVQALLVITHNGDGLPRWFGGVMGAVSVAALTAGHMLCERDALRTGSGFVLIILFVCLIGKSLRRLCLLVRALIKRKRAKERIRRYTSEKGMTFTQHNDPYFSLLFHSETPEWVVDTDDCRFILSLLPTLEPHNKIHFHENGIYATAKESGFLSRFAFGRMHTMPDAEILRGIFQMPPIDFERYHMPDQENIHILLLNPAPWEIDISRNGHVRLLHPNEAMPAPYGHARACTASDFLRLLSLEGK